MCAFSSLHIAMLNAVMESFCNVCILSWCLLNTVDMCKVLITAAFIVLLPKSSATICTCGFQLTEMKSAALLTWSREIYVRKNFYKHIHSIQVSAANLKLSFLVYQCEIIAVSYFIVVVYIYVCRIGNAIIFWSEHFEPHSSLCLKWTQRMTVRLKIVNSFSHLICNADLKDCEQLICAQKCTCIFTNNCNFAKKNKMFIPKEGLVTSHYIPLKKCYYYRYSHSIQLRRDTIFFR